MQRRPDPLTNYEKGNKIFILELQLQMARNKIISHGIPFVTKFKFLLWVVSSNSNGAFNCIEI